MPSAIVTNNTKLGNTAHLPNNGCIETTTFLQLNQDHLMQNGMNTIKKYNSIQTPNTITSKQQSTLPKVTAHKRYSNHFDYDIDNDYNDFDNNLNQQSHYSSLYLNNQDYIKGAADNLHRNANNNNTIAGTNHYRSHNKQQQQLSASKMMATTSPSPPPPPALPLRNGYCMTNSNSATMLSTHRFHAQQNKINNNNNNNIGGVVGSGISGSNHITYKCYGNINNNNNINNKNNNNFTSGGRRISSSRLYH